MIGKSLLHYDIKEQIGKGGMGEVFCARDTKLGRDVALKILPAELSGDPEREARFHREARALASLQHANVASVYGFEEVEGVRFLVMELVSGSELTLRMLKGPVPVAETQKIARQLAAGLEAAHENGIVHRDLKPANVMETDEGEIKILDFGLAQAWFGDDEGQKESSALPTITAAMTQVGAILGTAAYMSPEQARGASVDRRADIWAFGVILFEMLTGQRLFQGETISDTLAAVLRAEPDWESLPVEEAPELCRLIERCLERDPKQRLRDIGEARIFLQEGGLSGSNLSFSQLGLKPAAATPERAGLPLPLMAMIAAVMLVAGTFLGWKVVSRPEPAPLLYMMIPAPNDSQFELTGTAPGPAVVSPDGTKIAFLATKNGGVPQLYLRHMDKSESVDLAGTEGAAYPFWSADSRFIGFFVVSENKLKKVDAGGGPPVTLCAAPNGKGASWNKDGQIIMAPDFNDGIYVVPDIGGEPVRLTNLEPEYNSHRHPRFLPDGKHFLFVGRTGAEGQNDIFLASLDTTVAPRVIGTSQANADYIDEHLLFVREGVLMATSFTPNQEKPTAGAVPLVENVLFIPGAEVGVFSPSLTGMMIFQTGATGQNTQMLSWVDVGKGSYAGLGDPGQVFHPIISPDGTQALVEVRNVSNEGSDLWLVDLETGLRTRFTFGQGDEKRPVWSRDGTQVFYESMVDGTYRIMQQPVEGQGGAAIILEDSREIYPTSVSPDDRLLLLDFTLESSNFEMRRLPLEQADEELISMAATPEYNNGGGKYSPDGRWIAYHKETAAGWDIFVMSSKGGSRKWQITTDGSAYPVWKADGSELWVTRFNGDLEAFKVDGVGETFRVGSGTIKLTVPSPGADGYNYDLHPDGERVLQAGPDPAYRAEVSHLHMVTDWKRALTR